MRIAIIVLTLAAAALAAPADPSIDTVDPAPAEPPRLETTEKEDGVSKLEEQPEGAADDLKPDATFWGGFGWGYRPYYRSYSYWRPRYYYSAPYWGGWGGGYGYGYGKGYGGGWGGYWG